MAPAILELRRRGMDVRICVTGQHRQMLDPVLRLFGLQADIDLEIMRPGQDLTDVMTAVLAGMRGPLQTLQPAWVMVHGDTSTTLGVALAAYYQRIPVAHVEAGLRTGNKFLPWPEEMNRRLTGCLADLHFAPTASAHANLVREGIPESAIHVTGNTVVDALLQVVERCRSVNPRPSAAITIPPGRRLVLVTAHRRESFGPAFERICGALRRLASRPDVQIVYPVHLNPNVQEPVQRILSGLDNVALVAPLDYVAFVDLMDRAHLIITDSGGIQEEAPSLRKPVLVLREVTERPEALEAGMVRLVGTSEDSIVEAAARLLDDQEEYNTMTRGNNPYGDGHASRRIADILAQHLSPAGSLGRGGGPG